MVSFVRKGRTVPSTNRQRIVPTGVRGKRKKQPASQRTDRSIATSLGRSLVSDSKVIGGSASVSPGVRRKLTDYKLSPVPETDVLKSEAVDTGSVASELSGVDDNVSELGDENKRISRLFDTVFDKIETVLEGDVFEVSGFLSGKDFGEGKVSLTRNQLYQITDLLCDLSQRENISINDMLAYYKRETQKGKPQFHLIKHDFLIRSAILVASERTGGNLKSWQAYTKEDKYQPNDKNFWKWIENPQSWIAETQAASAKLITDTLIKSLILSEGTEKSSVIAYKGGFGAGKTSHGKETFGFIDPDTKQKPKFAGAVSPDALKVIVRRSLPEISHDTAHIQGSNIAYNIFEGLIALRSVVMPSATDTPKKKEIGSVVYDSSLAYHTDIQDLIRKSAAVEKGCKIVEIARYDVARSLAVLARRVDGQDPRIPLSFVVRGASNDRKYRAECMNAVLESTPLQKKDAIVRKHRYDFNCSNETGADAKLVCVLTSGEKPEWKIDKQDALKRMESIGLKYDESSNRFYSINPEEKWEIVLQQKLKNKVSDLIGTLSAGESKVRTEEFESRVLPFSISERVGTIEELYATLSEDFKECISLASFTLAFNNNLNAEELEELISEYDDLATKRDITYMDLPAAVAIDLNSKLIKTPSSWSK